MTTAEKRFIRLGERDYEIGSQAHLDAIGADHKAEVADLKKQIDALNGKLDSAEKAVESAKREKSDDEKKYAASDRERESGLTSRVKARVRLLMRAIRLFGEDDEDGDEGGDDKKKMDAKLDSLCEMSERDIHIKAITIAEPDFKADGKTDDYIAGKFDFAMKYLTKSRGVDGVVRVVESGRNAAERLDADDRGSRREHPVTKARREHHKRMRTAATPVTAREGGAQ